MSAWIDHFSIRTFCQNFKSTFSVGYLDATSMETLTGHSRHLNASPCVLSVTRYIPCKPVASITHHMTFAGNQTQSILPPVLISYLELYHPTKSMIPMNHFGMLGSLGSTMSRSILHILKFKMEDKFGA